MVDVANHHSLSSFYLSAFANSLALLINEVYQQKEQTEVQWNPKLPALFLLVLSIGNLFLTDFTGAHTFCLLLYRRLDECNRGSYCTHRMLPVILQTV